MGGSPLIHVISCRLASVGRAWLGPVRRGFRGRHSLSSDDTLSGSGERPGDPGARCRARPHHEPDGTWRAHRRTAGEHSRCHGQWLARGPLDSRCTWVGCVAVGRCQSDGGHDVTDVTQKFSVAGPRGSVSSGRRAQCHEVGRDTRQREHAAALTPFQRAPTARR